MNQASGTVSFLMGDGDGTFQTGETILVGNEPDAIVAGDFAGDGSLDLAVVDSSENGVSIFVGDGHGSFLGPSSTANQGISAMAVGDFNGDGRLDLAITNGETDSLSILLGNGDGTFQAGETIPMGIGPRIDRDGRFQRRRAPRPRRCESRAEMRSRSCWATATGRSSPPSITRSGSMPTALVAGDFNGDGILDLAVADSSCNEAKGEVSILMGNGDGTFRPAVNYPVGQDPDAIVAGEFGGDGILDLAVANENYSGNVSILLGNGDGTFRPSHYPVGQHTFEDGGRSPNCSVDPDAIVAGDFGGDGIFDLAVANSGDDDVSILLGNGDGTFQPAVNHPIGQSSNSFSLPTLIAGDFFGDGILDLAVPSSTGDDVSILLGNGDGTFQPPVNVPVGNYPR